MLPPSRAHRDVYRLRQTTTWLPDDGATPVQFQRLDNHGSDETVFPAYRLLSCVQRGSPNLAPTRQEQFGLTFGDYVSLLPRWEQDLLQPVQFASDAHSFMHTLHARCSANGGTKVYLLDVSDGSMANDTTTYGWIIGDTNGSRMAWCAGFGYGTATSHRAEAWGRLSAALFLYHILLFCKRDYPTQLYISSKADNQGMITSLVNRNGYKLVYPNATLASDWDILGRSYRTTTSNG